MVILTITQLSDIIQDMTTYLQIGRRETEGGIVPLILSDELVGIIAEAISNATLKGKMATGGGTTGRTPEGTELSNQLFELVRLLKEKHD